MKQEKQEKQENREKQEQKKKHANIPIFIPHMGCRHQCVFCDQNAITGKAQPSVGEIRETIESALGTLNGREAEIAFFGGSFTAIDRAYMKELLALASAYKKSGAVSGIRLSTRPDCLPEDVIDLLEESGVTCIEIGVQSMDDGVLEKSRRGHSSSDTKDAFARIKKRNCFSVVGQMMLGLPGSDEKKELFTAKEICAMGANGARIYPTAVLRRTALERAAAEGSYLPLTLEEGVLRGAHCLEVFIGAGVKVLRMGLCAEESCEEAIVGGCWHPSYGELVKSRLCFEKLNALLEKISPQKGEAYTIFTAEGGVSCAAGYKKENKKRLSERFGCAIAFAERKDLEAFEFDISKGLNTCA